MRRPVVDRSIAVRIAKVYCKASCMTDTRVTPESLVCAHAECEQYKVTALNWVLHVGSLGIGYVCIMQGFDSLCLQVFPPPHVVEERSLMLNLHKNCGEANPKPKTKP